LKQISIIKTEALQKFNITVMELLSEYYIIKLAIEDKFSN